MLKKASEKQTFGSKLGIGDTEPCFAQARRVNEFVEQRESCNVAFETVLDSDEKCEFNFSFPSKTGATIFTFGAGLMSDLENLSRKLKEEALRVRFRALVDTLPERLCIVSTTSTELHISRDVGFGGYVTASTINGRRREAPGSVFVTDRKSIVFKDITQATLFGI